MDKARFVRIIFVFISCYLLSLGVTYVISQEEKNIVYPDLLENQIRHLFANLNISESANIEIKINLAKKNNAGGYPQIILGLVILLVLKVY